MEIISLILFLTLYQNKQKIKLEKHIATLEKSIAFDHKNFCDLLQRIKKLESLFPTKETPLKKEIREIIDNLKPNDKVIYFPNFNKGD